MATRLNANRLRINTLADTGAITALPNRSVIDHLLRFALAPEPGQAFHAAILFIDLDGFKRVNDTVGHEGGDELPRQASRRILERGLGRTLETIDTCTDPFGNPCSRLPQDTVLARFAGDAFVAVLPGLTDRAALLRLALQRGELLLHDQPKVDAGRLALCGAEALARQVQVQVQTQAEPATA